MIFFFFFITQEEWGVMNMNEKVAFLDTVKVQEFIKVLPFVEKDSSFVKMKAAEICGKKNIKESFDFLIKMLKDSSSAVRFEATWALGKLKDERALKYLLMALKDKDDAVRFNSLVALRNFNLSGVVKEITPLLVDENKKIRKEALITIGKLTSTPPAEVIKLLDDKEKDIVFTAINIIGNANDYKIVKNLERFMVCEDSLLKTCACLFLARFNKKEAVLQLIDNIDVLPDSLRIKAVAIIVKFPVKEISKKGIEKLIVDDAWMVRKEVAEQLKNFNNRKEILEEFLKKENHPAVLEALLTTIGETEERDLAPLVRKFLNDPNPLLREAACRAVGLLRDTLSFNELIKNLIDDSPSVRVEAVIALGRIKDKRAIPYIKQRLFDAGWEVQEAACHAAGMIKDEQLIPSLEQLLFHKFWGIRKHALWALVRIGSKKTDEKKLKRLLRDENYEVRTHALLCLCKIGTINENELPEDVDEFTKNACLIMLGKGSWSTFKKMILKNPLRGIYLLEMIGTEKAKEVLKELSRYGMEEISQKARIALLNFN